MKGLYSVTHYIYMFIVEDGIDEKVADVAAGYSGSSKDHFYWSKGASKEASSLYHRERACGCPLCFMMMPEECQMLSGSGLEAGIIPPGSSVHLEPTSLSAESRQTRDSLVDPLEGAATYLWVLTKKEVSRKITTTKPTQTSPDYMTSFRGKLAKNWRRNANDKVDINLELWCDNKSVLKAINPKVKSTFVALCKPKGALVHQTQTPLQQMRRVALNCVKGHQED